MKKQLTMSAMLSSFLLGGIVAAGNGTPIPEGYQPFPLQWDDTLSGTATDVSFLNEKPAGKNGRLIVRDGHFVESATGKRVRLIGIGIGGDALFEMDHKAAEKVARRLAKAGVNVVRFHNLDGSDRDRDTLIDFSKPGSEHFNAKHLDTLDYFFSCLKKEGIYTVMGLKVNRTLRKGDDLPDGVQTAGKRIDRFNRAWIESQKRWAKNLLTHRNPYTGTTLADDPAVLSLELNNESSLLFENLNWIDSLPSPYKKELTGLWNDFLKRRYQTDKALLASWNRETLSPGETLLNPDGRWCFEQGDALKILRNSSDSVAAEVKRRSSQDWQIQFQRPGLTLENGKTYTLEFDARGEGSPVRVVLSQDRPDWHNCGLEASFQPTGQWKHHRFTFRAKNADPGHVRISFGVGHARKAEIAGVRLYPGSAPVAACLSSGNVPLPAAPNDAMSADLLDFMVELDTRYAEEMLNYLRKDLGVKSLVIDTQIDWGGLSGLRREKNMDYVDVHAYWGHPEFTGGSWEFKPGFWKIHNQSQIPRIVHGGWCALEQFSRYRIRTKPLSISEHDYPYPHDYAVEMMPLLTCVGLRQDWDMLQLFIHGTFLTRGESKGISHMFDQTNHPGKIGFFPAAALIFRRGLFEPAERTIELRLPETPWRWFGNRFDRAWAATGVRRSLLDSRMTILPDAVKTPGRAEAVVSTPDEPARPMRAWTEKEKAFFTAVAPQCIVLCGHFGGQTMDVGDLHLKTRPFPGNFGAAVLVSRDNRPLTSSADLLFTIAGRFENSGVIWNKERNATLNRSPWWGNPPVLGTKTDAEVRMKTDGPRTVYALDSNGRRTAEVPSDWENGHLSFRVLPEHRSMHYEILQEKGTRP